MKQPSWRVLGTSETMNYLGLDERETGLRSVQADKFPHLEMSSVIEQGPDRNAMVQRVADQAKDPNIVGIFTAADRRNSLIVDAVKSAGRQPGKTVYVRSDLTETFRRLMIDGWMVEVIGLPANRAGKAVIRAMIEAADRGNGPRWDTFEPLRV